MRIVTSFCIHRSLPYSLMELSPLLVHSAQRNMMHTTPAYRQLSFLHSHDTLRGLGVDPRENILSRPARLFFPVPESMISLTHIVQTIS